MRKILFLLLLLPIGVLISQSETENCLRCHSMETLGYRDPITGSINNLSVNLMQLEASNHSGFDCIDCHSDEYGSFPHDKELKEDKPFCLDCHEGGDELNFDAITSSFESSVHFTKLGDKFTCFQCHDPHSFKINARVNDDIKRTVLYDNHICLECHSSEDKISKLTDRVFPSLEVTHDFLPHRNLHWKNVRCIDCHAALDEGVVSHNILPKEEAVHNCVECHSKDSRLTHSLYQFQVQEERSKAGFFNSVILNESYVIGATRNYYLNLLSFIFFAVTLIALAIHGYFYAGSKKKPEKEHKIKKEYFYPLWLRIWHWFNAFLFLGLIFTGITLQYSSTEDPILSFGTAITIHNTCGVLLTLNYFFFVLGNFISGNYKQYIPKIRGLIKRMFLQAKFYLIGIFKNEPHPFDTSLKHKFNPLQGVTYFKIMYFAIPFMIISGWALLFPEIILDELFGTDGLFLTALFHSMGGFFLSLFMFGHIYLATLGRTPLSNIKSMVNGWHELHDEDEIDEKEKTTDLQEY